MNNYDKIRKMSLGEMARFLNSLEPVEAPWDMWFNKTYCENCPAEISDKYGRPQECTYCELHDKCRYFPGLPSTPTSMDTLHMWLGKEVD